MGNIDSIITLFLHKGTAQYHKGVWASNAQHSSIGSNCDVNIWLLLGVLGYDASLNKNYPRHLRVHPVRKNAELAKSYYRTHAELKRHTIQ